MPITRWDERFFASTRGQVVTLLRRGASTVDELARVLDLTDNAVRAHLAALERDGVVRQAGLRRGAGKPAFAYELTPEAERLFPKAYGPVLRTLLDVLGEHLPPETVDAAMREVGRRMAAAHPAPTDQPLAARVEGALALLEELGGLAEAEPEGDTYVIRGFSCPLAAAVPGHPTVCRLAEALLTDVIGTPVQARCEHGACRFLVSRQPSAVSRPLPSPPPLPNPGARGGEGRLPHPPESSKIGPG